MSEFDFEALRELRERMEKRILSWGYVPQWREVEDVDLLAEIPILEEDPLPPRKKRGSW